MTRRLTWRSMQCLPILLTGCGAGPQASAPTNTAPPVQDGAQPGPTQSPEPPSPSFVHLDPSDRTTSFPGGAVLRLVVSQNRGTTLPVALKALERALSLETWPEGDVLSFRTETFRLSTNTTGDYWQIALVPSEALPDRWLALRLIGALPDGVQLREHNGNWPHPRGGVMSRFRPGRETVVVSAYRALKKGGLSSVGLTFSEPVSLTEVPGTTIVVENDTGTRFHCVLADPPARGVTRSELAVHCQENVGLPFVVKTTNGIVTGTGEAVPVQAVAFVVGDYLESCGDGCVFKRP
jgi:hypothetical protein